MGSPDLTARDLARSRVAIAAHRAPWLVTWCASWLLWPWLPRRAR